MNLSDFTKPYLTEKEKEIIKQSFEDARKDQERIKNESSQS